MPFNRFFLNRNDGFIVMSEQVQKDLLFYLPKAKHILIPHPIYNHFGEKIPKTIALQKLGISECSGKKVLLRNFGVSLHSNFLFIYNYHFLIKNLIDRRLFPLNRCRRLA